MIAKKFLIHTTFLMVLLALTTKAKADSWRYQTRGFLSARLSTYTEEKSRNYGQLTRAQFEQLTEFSTNLTALNQLRWTSNTIDTDLSTKSTPSKKDNFDAYLGENYIKYKSDSWVAQIGYQEVVWGEAFGFNYADIINPKDQRQTFFSDASEARLPLLLFNGKSFFSSGDFSGSLQFLYSPEPRFSKTLPIDIYAGNLFLQSTLKVIKERTPQMFKETEIGGKISASYAGFDLALFTFSYLDREPHYLFSSATLTNITLQEEHTKIKSSGFSLAKTIYDFVFRTDVVMTQDKLVNYTVNSQLKTFSTSSLNALVSLDTPTYNDFSGVLILARSTLKDIMLNSFRQRQEQYFIGKISKNLGNEKALEFSYIHEFENSGHSVQTFLNWPINNLTDLKLGGEFYFGDDLSNLKKFKNVSSVFVSIKNYFQL
ncbi:MAG: hypothetical protein H7281_13165 [Bacteriovorax sp.]|nr:hypothetical protein [Bacteriovorax sp.]